MAIARDCKSRIRKDSIGSSPVPSTTRDFEKSVTSFSLISRTFFGESQRCCVTISSCISLKKRKAFLGSILSFRSSIFRFEPKILAENLLASKLTYPAWDSDLNYRILAKFHKKA